MTDDIDAEIEQRVNAVDRVYITTPKVKEAIDLIKRTRKARRQDGTAHCSLITGVSGTGKSRLFSRYMENQPVPESGTMPLVYVMTPAPFTQVGFARAFLRAMGKPVISGQDQDTMLDRIQHYLGQLRTELVMLEEISHVVDRKAKDAKVPYWVTDTIKLNFLEKAKVPIVMNGVPVAKDLFRINSQLETRRLDIVELMPYDMADNVSRESFMVLLELYERATGFPKKVLAGNEALARRVYWATHGVYGHLAKLMKDATELAVRRGTNGLTVEVLADACARLADPEKGWENPFLVAAIPRQETADESRVTLLHKRGQKAPV